MVILRFLNLLVRLYEEQTIYQQLVGGKKMIKNYMMMFVLIIPVQVFCSYPTEQEAEMLFSSNVLNKVDRINNSQYETFLMRMKRPTTMETRKIVESKVLNGIMSINVSVSTNCIDESRGVIMISGAWVRRLSDCFQPVDFMTNHVVCISMAKYIGTLKQIDFPENLLRDAGPIVIMRSLNQYRRSDDEIVRIKKEKNEAHRMALYEQNKEAYNLQRRVKTANYNVRRYRCELFSLCGKSIAGCRKMMNDEEFSNFTNQVVRLSNASEKEQTILFQKLNEELRAHNKK